MSELRKGPRQNGNESALARARIDAGLTQGMLAEKVGCSQKDISRWETGCHKPSLEKICKLAEALNESESTIISFFRVQ